ncbi:MAG TPA: phosphoribosylanthranilate isomerase [Candidatus Krumholzibacteria bacterium]|nr:phosphoribosylanthranilate isomerase [Candidatus Krumholzibacteria bacterium]
MSAPLIKIKICGITSPQDARLAVALGADFVGLIFAESPRRIDVARAAEIRAAVPGAVLVGVFRDPAIDDVIAAVRGASIDLVQLHGAESPAFSDEVLARTGKPIIKVFNSNRVPRVEQLAAYTKTSYFLFDTSKDATVSDDTRLEQVARIRGMGFRVFLAGGLTPDNVRASVRATRPFAVDVCRGVEKRPGVKDALALERFIAEVRG